MILCRTPLRVSFVGGGTDVPAYYREAPGAVLATAINRYLYVSVNSRFDTRLRISYATNELVDNVAEIRHDLAREALACLKVTQGTEVSVISDVPSEGTGLGSSSSCGVGLLNALHRLCGHLAGPEQLAQEACELEICRCQRPIGKQDQYIAAYGGLRLYEFLPDERVRIQNLCMAPAQSDALQRRLLLFYTGLTRSANPLLTEQQHNLRTRPSCRVGMARMAELAYTLFRDLQSGQLDSFGAILEEAWCRKRELACGISSPQIDAWYSAARRAGATGGKLLGAGGGGFLLFYVPLSAQDAVRSAIGLPEMQFAFEPQGSTIVYQDPERIPVCVSS